MTGKATENEAGGRNGKGMNQEGEAGWQGSEAAENGEEYRQASRHDDKTVWRVRRRDTRNAGTERMSGSRDGKGKYIGTKV